MKTALIEHFATTLHGGGLRMISGKWFNTNTCEEIRNISHYVAKAAGTLDRTAVDKIIDGMILLQADTAGLWPEIEFPKVCAPLPFPLDFKQLIIINRLLYHRFDGDRNLFITTGIGGSGKSTFLNIVQQLHYNDIASSNLADLSNDFIFAEAVSHRLICSDELAGGELDLPKLKILASRNKCTVNPKFKTPYEIQTQSNCFWCCNTVPRLDITDSGMLRRIVFYERNTRIPNPDTKLSHKVYTDEELAIIATQAKEYDFPDWFETYFEIETHKYLMQSNSVWICWRNSYCDYKELCVSKGYKPFAEEKWKTIHDLFQEWIDKINAGRKDGPRCYDLPF